MLGIPEFVIVLLIAMGAGLISYVVMGSVGQRLTFTQSHNRLVIFLFRRADDVIDGLFGFLTLIFCLMFVAICLRRYETLSFFGDDFLFFDQAIWNSLHGRLLENTAYLDSPTILGHHFSPVLLALVPLYVFGDGPRVLSVLPAIVVAVSAFPLYWFARQQIGRTLALAILVAFFLSPVVQYLATVK